MEAFRIVEVPFAVGDGVAGHVDGRLSDVRN